jgi:hypothetical protein
VCVCEREREGETDRDKLFMNFYARIILFQKEPFKSFQEPSMHSFHRYLRISGLPEAY